MIEKVRPKLPCAYQLQDVGDTHAVQMKEFHAEQSYISPNNFVYVRRKGMLECKEEKN